MYENVFSHKVARCHSNEGDGRQPRDNQQGSKIQWVRRFKQRWNGAFGSVKKQNGLSEGELRKQADGVLRRFFFSFWNRFLGPCLGPENGPVFGTSEYSGLQNGTRFLGQKSGPGKQTPNTIFFVLRANPIIRKCFFR